jgi:hypothetical protein
MQHQLETWIEFCEPTYVRVAWIAEFWNAVSSLAYCVPGIMLIWLTERCGREFPAIFNRGVVWRQRLCGICWILLGLGSAAFHATQTVWAELWDEIAMFASVLSVNFCLFDMHPLTTSRRAVWFYGALLLFTALTVGVYVQIQFHPFFAACFMVSALVPLALSATLPIDINGGKVKLYEEKPLRVTRATDAARLSALATIAGISILGPMERTRSIWVGAIVSVVGYTIWHIDQRCVKDHWPTLHPELYELDWYYWAHPMWHVCTSVAVVFFLDAICKLRLESFFSPLARRLETGSFISIFSVGTSLKYLSGIQKNQ